jgi:RNA 2',3'-cyclic 3'-phosphodiesterase
MKRTFIAVTVETGNELVEMISILRSTLKNDSIKWIDPDHLHITLAFLGDTRDDAIKQISSMLVKTCSGFGDFTFTISGLGIFRNFNDPRVIWAGIERSDKFEKLYDILKSGLNELGIETEDRQFNPHLTLGRIKYLNSRDQLVKLIHQYSKTVFQHVSISEIVFYESILKPSGPMYVPIAVTKLN